MASIPKTLNEWEESIKKEVPFVDIKPFSHNIISLALSAIAKEHGNEAANKTIRKLKLRRLGWVEVTDK